MYNEALHTDRLFHSDQFPLILSTLREIDNVYLERDDVDLANAYWDEASRISQKNSQNILPLEENNTHNRQDVSSKKPFIIIMDIYSNSGAA